MKIVVYFGHPAQYLFLRATLKELIKQNDVKILIKSKDILEDLIEEDGFLYTNILKNNRGNSKLSIIISLFKRLIRLFPYFVNFKPNVVISTDASIAILGRLFNIKCISITEDDYDIIKSLADITYPFTNTILCPKVCNVGKWNEKKIGYDGYMKLAYLHPQIFKPNIEIIQKYSLEKDYAIVRLAKLQAFHDIGVNGISNLLLDTIIKTLKNKNIRTYISAENQIDEKYMNYLLKINPSDMHHVLSYAKVLVCDSQSMSVESSMLGVPSIRYSNFAGKISVLEELEKKYELTFGIKEGDEKILIEKLNELIADNSLKDTFQKRRLKMLNDKINVTNFLIWFIQNYPNSVKTLQVNPDFQLSFK